MSQQTTLKVAICIYPKCDMLDYIGPLEFMSFANIRKDETGDLRPKYIFDITFVAPSKDVIVADNSSKIVPDEAYATANTQFDIILIPGGPFNNTNELDSSIFGFLSRQVPKAKYVLTVCVGSWILAASGQLPAGSKATTNKSMYKVVTSSTEDKKIQWVPKARYVVDDSQKFWTGSGLSAGLDLANAFMVHLYGKEYAKSIAVNVEFSPKDPGDDEFAVVHGLV